MSSSPVRRAIYRGKVKGQQAIRHGEGQSFYPECGGDLFHFQGVYNKGVKTNGKFTFKGHSTYEGEFDVNQSGEIEGIGTRIWNDGRQYTGNWAHGEMNGEGKWTSADGDEVYEGTFYENKRHGMGVLTKTIGSDTHTYSGPFEAHKYHGRGSYIVSGKAAAVGDFQQGIMQGECEITWDNCSSFKGYMKDGMITSHGSYRSISDAYIFEGQYVKGLPSAGYSTAINATLDRSGVPVDAPIDTNAKKAPPPKKGSEPVEEFAAILGPGDFIGDVKVKLTMQQGPMEALALLEAELLEAQANKKPDPEEIKSLEDKISVLKLIVVALKEEGSSGTNSEVEEEADGQNETQDEMVTGQQSYGLNADKRSSFKNIAWAKEIRRRLSLRLLAVDPDTSEVATDSTPICIVPMTIEEKASSYSRFASAIRCYVSGEDVQVSKPESAVELIKDDQGGAVLVKFCDEWFGLSNVHQLSSGASLQVKFDNAEAIERNGLVSMNYLVDFSLDLAETIRSLNALKEASADLPEFVEMTIMTLDHDSASKNDVLSLELKFPTSEITHLISNQDNVTVQGDEKFEGELKPTADSADKDNDKAGEYTLPVAHLDNCLWRMMITHEPDDVDDLLVPQPPVGTIKIIKISYTDNSEDVNGVELRCGHLVASTTTTLQEPIEFPWNGVNNLIVKIVNKDDKSVEKGDVKIFLPTLSLFENPTVALATDMELEHSTSGGRISIEAEFTPIDPVFGTLYVNILSCGELVAADSRSNTSLSDPFVRVTLGGDQKMTTIKDNDLNPVYNEMLALDWNGKDKLTLNVFDKDENKTNDPIGDVSNIDICELNLLANVESEDEKVNDNGGRVLSFLDVELKNENPVNPKIKYMHGTISYELSLEKNPLHFWPKEEAERRYADHLREEEAKRNAQPPKKEVFAWSGGNTLSTNRWHSVALMVTPDYASFYLDGATRLCSTNQNNNNSNNTRSKIMLPNVGDNVKTNTNFFVGGEGFDGFVKSIAVFGECDNVDPVKLTSCYETDGVLQIMNEEVHEEKVDKNEKVDVEGTDVEAMQPVLPSGKSFEFDACAGYGSTSAQRLRLPPDIKDGIYVIEISDAIEVPCRLSGDIFTAAATARENQAAAAAATAPDSQDEDIRKAQQEASSSKHEEHETKSPTTIASVVSMVHELQSFKELRIKVERNVAV